MTAPRTSGTGRRFELVLIRLQPPVPRTVGLIAKHATRDTYHWVLVTGSRWARPEPLSRLLAVAYLDEAKGWLGRGDPRWAVPRAYLRRSGAVEREESPRWDSPGLAPFVREELARIASWLREREAEYLEGLAGALRGVPDDRFRPLGPDAARRRGFRAPAGRALLAPPPPPVVTRSRPAASRTGPITDPADRLPWRRFHAGHG